MTLESDTLERVEHRVQQVHSAMQQLTNDLRDMQRSLLQRSRILVDLVDTLEGIRHPRQSHNQPARMWNDQAESRPRQ